MPHVTTKFISLHCWVALVLATYSAVLTADAENWLDQECSADTTALIQTVAAELRRKARSEFVSPGLAETSPEGLASTLAQGLSAVVLQNSAPWTAEAGPAKFVPTSAAQLLREPTASEHSLASALLQSERAQLAERQMTLRVLAHDAQLRSQAAEASRQMAELKQALEAEVRSRPDEHLPSHAAGPNASGAHWFISNSKHDTGNAFGLPTRNNGTNAVAVLLNYSSFALSTAESAANITLAQGSSSSILGLSSIFSEVSKLPPEYRAAMAFVLTSCLLALVTGVIGTCVGYLDYQPCFGSKTSQFGATTIFLAIIPCLFMIGSMIWVRLVPDFFQYWVYLALVMVLMLIQSMVAAGPIAVGLVDAACTLPEVLANAFVGLQDEIADELESLVVGLLGDNNPADSLIRLVVAIITKVIGPVIQQCARILDVRHFLPEAFFDVYRLSPLLGLALFVLFLNMWAILASLLPLKLGIVTTTVTLLLWGLLVASLFASKIVIGFILLMEVIVNYAFKTLLIQLLPAEAFQPALNILGPSVPTAEHFKMKIVDCCRLKLKLEDDDDDGLAEEVEEAVQDAYKCLRCC